MEHFKPVELAKTWKTSLKTVYRLIRQGRIKAFRIGRGYRVSRKALEAFINGKSSGEKN